MTDQQVTSRGNPTTEQGTVQNDSAPDDAQGNGAGHAPLVVQSASLGPTGGGRPRVVVIGAGFGGMAVVQELANTDVDIMIIDRHGYNTFQPLLYQVATGGLNPGDVTYSLRAFTAKVPNAAFRQGLVTSIDPDAQKVTLQDGATIAYDYLVVATGVTANFFGIKGAAEHSLLIYTRAQAIETRDHMFRRLELLASTEVSHDVEVNVVVVGGGATGVEMAGTVAEMVQSALPRTYPELDPDKVSVHLVEMADYVLAPFHPRLRDYAAKALRKRGVKLHLGTAVDEITDEEVRLKDGTVIRTGTVIWATGVTAPAEVSGWNLPQGRGGRIQVGSDTRVVGYPSIFAIGDVAGHVEKPLPQVAQPALQQGAHAAEQIRRTIAGLPTTEFVYKDKGIMATIGRRAAVAQVPKIPGFSGTLAWLAWLGLHVVVLLSFRNRFAVLTNLTWRYLAYPRNVNVIVGN